MLLRIGLALSMTLGMSFAHAQDLEDNAPMATPAAPATHDDFNSDVDKAAQTSTEKTHATASEPTTKSNEVGGASGKKSKKSKAGKKKRTPSSVGKKKSKKHGSKKKKKHS